MRARRARRARLNGADRRPAGRAHRAAEHRVRPRRGVAVAADRPPRAARGARRSRSIRSTRWPDRSSGVIDGDVASVHQIFSGPVAGDALLILDQSGAAMLKELLTNEPALPLSIDASAREVHHRGRQHPAQRLPRHVRQPAATSRCRSRCRTSASRALGAILESLRVNREGVQYALVVHAGFKLRDAEVTRLPGHRAERRLARSPDSRGRGLGAATTGEAPPSVDAGGAAGDCARSAGSTSSPIAASSRPTPRWSSAPGTRGSKPTPAFRRRTASASRCSSCLPIAARRGSRSATTATRSTARCASSSQRFHKFLIPVSRGRVGGRRAGHGAERADRAARLDGARRRHDHGHRGRHASGSSASASCAARSSSSERARRDRRGRVASSRTSSWRRCRTRSGRR